jgi:hypothetical protein
VEALRVATHVDEAAHIVEVSLRQGAVGRPLLWTAVGIVAGGVVAAGVAALAGAGPGLTAPMLFAAAAVALVAAWLDERHRAARWESWTRDFRAAAVPPLREAVLAATPDEAVRLGRRVADAIARNSAHLPEPPRSVGSKELRFLDGIVDADPAARILAWLAAEVCGGARQPERLVRCPFLMALKRAALERVIADG